MDTMSESQTMPDHKNGLTSENIPPIPLNSPQQLPTNPWKIATVVLGVLLVGALGLLWKNVEMQPVTTSGNVAQQVIPSPDNKLVPPSDPIEDWITIVDEEFGFTLRLPPYFDGKSLSWSQYNNVHYASVKQNPGATETDRFFSSEDASKKQLKQFFFEVYNNSLSLPEWQTQSDFARSHEFVTTSNPGKNVIRFAARNMGKTGYMDDDRVSGFAIHTGNEIVVMMTSHYKNNQQEVDEFIDNVFSTVSFGQLPE